MLKNNNQTGIITEDGVSIGITAANERVNGRSGIAELEMGCQHQ